MAGAAPLSAATAGPSAAGRATTGAAAVIVIAILFVTLASGSLARRRALQKGHKFRRVVVMTSDGGGNTTWDDGSREWVADKAKSGRDTTGSMSRRSHSAGRDWWPRRMLSGAHRVFTRGADGGVRRDEDASLSTCAEFDDQAEDEDERGNLVA